MGQNNNHKSNFHFLILGCNPLQSITAWSLERIDITRRWVSSLVMLSPGLYCNRLQFLLVSWGIFPSVFSSQVKCMLNRIQSGDWLGHCITVQFFPFKNSCCFCSMLWVIVHLHCEAPSNEFRSIWLIWADNIARNTSDSSCCLLSAVTSSINTREQFHWQPYMPTPWHYHTMLHWWGGMLRIMSSSFPSPYSSLPITLVQVDLGLICP